MSPAYATTTSKSPRLSFAGNIVPHLKILKTMVTIIDYKLAENSLGKQFVSLKLQSGVEAVQSQATGRFYLTARMCSIASTFTESVVKAMIGTQIPGKIVRVDTDPYVYKVPETGEEIILTHRY